jgi:hypothetical protein
MTIKAKKSSKKSSKRPSKIRQKRMKYKPDFYVAPPVFIKIV